MDIVIITTIAQIVLRLLAHDTHARRRPRHSSIALSMTLWFIPMPNVQQTLLLLFMIFNCLNTYN